MKMKIVYLGCLFLAACSGGGGNSGNLGNRPINPLERPANPASIADITALFTSMKAGGANLPEEEALFSEIFYGDSVQKVEEGGEQQKKSLAKLNSMGLRFRDKIKKDCVLSPVTKVSTENPNSTPKEGETVTNSLSISSSGSRCEYLMNKSFEGKKFYKVQKYEQETGVATSSIIETQTEKESVEIRNAEVINASGLKARKQITNTTAESESITGGGTNTWKYSRSSSGYVDVTLADGKRLSGPVVTYSKSITTSKNDKTENLQNEGGIQMKLSSASGDIWVAIVFRNRDTQEFYVNGNKVSKEDMEKIGFGVQD